MEDRKPRTAEEYVKLVDRAILEADELCACYEFDMEDPGDHLRYLEPLQEGLRRLRQSMADGSYEFENKELPFMVLVKRYHEQLPFARLLLTINETHRYGLDISAE